VARVLENRKKKVKRVERLIRQYDCSTIGELLSRLYSDRDYLELTIARLEFLNRLRSGDATAVRRRAK
jgi:hypothetical protein